MRAQNSSARKKCNPKAFGAQTKERKREICFLSSYYNSCLLLRRIGLKWVKKREQTTQKRKTTYFGPQIGTFAARKLWFTVFFRLCVTSAHLRLLFFFFFFLFFLFKLPNFCEWRRIKTCADLKLAARWFMCNTVVFSIRRRLKIPLKAYKFKLTWLSNPTIYK